MTRRVRFSIGLVIAAVVAAILPLVGVTPASAVSTTMVINEVDYDQDLTDQAEYLELKNVSGGPLDLTGWTVQLVNGSGGGAALYDTISLTPAGVVADGDYVVVCANAGTVANCDIDDAPEENFIQNGSPDAIGLRDDAATLIDALSYEGNSGAPYLEGTGAGTDNPAGSTGLSRCADGVDTDDNSADFVERPITPGAANDCPGGGGGGDCGDAVTLVHDIQGGGPTSPIVGSTVAVEGVVVGDFQGATGLDGFYLQEEDADADANTATSEGIFVFNNAAVAVGDEVRVEGTVAETFGQTQLTTITHVLVCSSGNPLPTPAPVVRSIQVLNATDLETVEGMRVNLAQTLSVNETFTQARYGEVLLAVGLLDQPTDETAPGPSANNLQTLNNRRKILLDDGSNVENPADVPYVTDAAGETLRRGSTTSNITGVMGYGFSNYRVHPTAPVTFTDAPRPTTVPDVGSDLTVASFNVLNYFTTIDNGSNGARGADSAGEFTRQKDKLVEAITTLDADVLGLIEIESNGDTAIADLVSGLNAVAGPGTYDFISDPVSGVGTDAIKVAFIYQPGSVVPVGNPTSDTAAIHDRAPVAQLFEDPASNERFWAVANHFKSKGSCPGVGDPNADQGDGQSCWNPKRVEQAQALDAFIDTDLAPIDSDVLIIGDLNSYAEEDPISILETEGYQDLMEAFVPPSERYSYVFQGQAGYLDHALASPTLANKVTGTAPWHINADEPIYLDYNTEFNPAPFYVADEFRSSDHDPVLVGLGFEAVELEVGDVTVTASRQGPNVGMYFPITINRPFAHDIEVGYETVDGSATSGSDYVARTGVATIPAGKTQATVAVFARPYLLSDTDPAEDFTLEVTSVDQPVDVVDGVGGGTIRPRPDSELGTLISVGDVTIAETDEKTRLAYVTITASQACGCNIEMDVSLVEGTALEPQDFRDTTGTVQVTIPANVRFVRVPVRIVGDLDVEGDEVLTVLAEPTAGAGAADGTGTLTIRNDD